jgi:pyruvate/2-oxoglutarate dehydrogenase complex dihydrolipoamide acyltransferase (E2) component
MSPDSPNYTAVPFPRMRQLVLDGGWMSRRRQIIHGLVEFDVTDARGFIRDHESETGERLSFTAFLVACIGRAVAADRYVHAMRDWRNRLIIFDDVDVMVVFEIQAGERTFPLVQPLRRANERSVYELHREIRAIQANPESSENTQGGLLRRFYLLPTFLRHIVYRAILKNPHWFREFGGTVAVTSVGMFGSGGGWGISTPNHTLSIVVGGIAERPTVVEGRIEIRELLSLTIAFDHDVIDGAPAARFGQRLKELVEGGLKAEDWGVHSPGNS